VDSWDHPALFIILAIEMLFPFAADVVADLVLCALYLEVSTKVACITQSSLNPSAYNNRGNNFVRLRVINKKLLYITLKNICISIYC